MCTHRYVELRLIFSCTYTFLGMAHTALNASWQLQLVPASFFSKPTWMTEAPRGFLQTTYLQYMGHKSCIETNKDLSTGLVYVLNCVWFIKLSYIKMSGDLTQMMNKPQLCGNKLLPIRPLFTCHMQDTPRFSLIYNTSHTQEAHLCLCRCREMNQ